MEHQLLILGIGNDILSDDGIAIKLTEDIRKMNICDAHYKTMCVGGMEIVETIRNYANVIIIDAIKTENGIPAEVYHFTPSDFKETMHISSFHDITFLEAVELGKTLEFQLPENIHIIAVEIREDLVFSEHFTKEIQSKYKTILKKVIRYIDFIRKECIMNKTPDTIV